MAHQYHRINCEYPLARPEWVPTYDTGSPRNMSGTAQYHSTPGDGDDPFLWRDTPAFDLLNLGKNEGMEYQGDPNLYFAGR